MNGKRKKKRDTARQIPTDGRPALPAPQPEERTGTLRVMLDNTVPGGVRYEHTPGRVP